MTEQYQGQILKEQECKQYVESAVGVLADYIIENNRKQVTVGISGGIDSSVMAVIGLKTIDELVSRGAIADTMEAKAKAIDYVYIDIESAPEDLERATALSEAFNFSLRKLDLTEDFERSSTRKRIPPEHKHARVAQGNIKAKMRMTELTQIALLNEGLYLDSDDLSEGIMGFWTRHGDEGDINVTRDVTKTEMYDLGRYLEVPQIILDALPGDGLNVTEGNLATDQLGLPYIQIEYIVSRFIGKNFIYNRETPTKKSDDRLPLDKLRAQLEAPKYITLMEQVAQELKIDKEKVLSILERSLNTAWKRDIDSSREHLPDRTKFGFPAIGSEEFNKRYLKAIKNIQAELEA